MSIGIFLGSVGTQAGGCETYEKTLVSTLCAEDRDHPYDIFFLNERAKSNLGPLPENFTSHVLSPDNRWVSMTLSLPTKLLLANRIKVLHATYFPPYFCPTDLIAMMHSVVTYVLPELYPVAIRLRLQALMNRIIKQANIIVCVSQHDRDFLASRFGIPDERLVVIYHGVDSVFHPRSPLETGPELKRKYSITKPYFIYVGKLMRAKNILRTLEAFQVFRNRHPNTPIEMVLVGRRLWMEGEDANQLDQLIGAGGVKELGHVPHEDLPLLYAGAHALVFPSYWEGFGIPIIEAMASGIPILTSNISSCPEVASDAALLVDPFDLEEIVHNMERLTEDTALCHTLTTKGLARAKEFTWDRAAAQTLDLYGRFDATFRR